MARKRVPTKRNAYGPTSFELVGPNPEEVKETKRLENEQKEASLDAIAKAVQTLRELGFKVEVPSSEEEKTKHQESLVKLGLAQPKENKAKPKTKSSAYLTGVLRFRHNIGNQSFGPGEFKLKSDQTDLYRSLLQQDQAATLGLQDSKEYIPEPKCYIIASGENHGRPNQFSKVEVSSGFMNSAAFLSVTSLDARNPLGTVYSLNR